jgi:hypothetical protein
MALLGTPSRAAHLAFLLSYSFYWIDTTVAFRLQREE